jgi:hypothetical protein
MLETEPALESSGENSLLIEELFFDPGICLSRPSGSRLAAQAG